MAKRVAVIGCGAAGLSASYLLGQEPDIRLDLYEKDSRLGGHANTVLVNGVPVDTGFLVYNENTYPNLIGMFEALNVPTEPSDMSFSVSLQERTYEWSSNGLDSLFATRSNIVSPAFYSMLSDMLRFNKEAPAFLEKAKQDPTGTYSKMTMGQFLSEYKYGLPFRNYYLIPQVAAVWSASAVDVLAFPATTFIQFCVNHSLIQIMDRPQWRTVSRRSREYIRRIIASLPRDRTNIFLNTTIAAVSRKANPTTGGTLISVTDQNNVTREYDELVFGCHPDEILALYPTMDSAELEALRGFKYQPNVAYLHTDDEFMPKKKSAWSSWNYLGKGDKKTTGKAQTYNDIAEDDVEPCCVTYYLNLLQNLNPKEVPDLFVTLNPNPNHIPKKEKIIQELHYAHPQYSVQAIQAQQAIDKLQGYKNTYYAGAYLGYGFHEDAITAGVRAAIRVTKNEPRWWKVPLYTLPKVILEEGKAVDTTLHSPQLVNGSSNTSTSTSTSSTSKSKPPADAILTTSTTLSKDHPHDYVSLESIRNKKAAGGPYWTDNYGNGGPVGKATEVIKTVVQDLLRPMQAEALLERKISEEKHISPADKSISMEYLLGETQQNDIHGYLLQHPGDVLYAYRELVKCGKEVRSSSSVPTNVKGLPVSETSTSLSTIVTPTHKLGNLSINTDVTSTDDSASDHDEGSSISLSVNDSPRSAYGDNNSSLATSTKKYLSKFSNKHAEKTNISFSLGSEGGVDVTKKLLAYQHGTQNGANTTGTKYEFSPSFIRMMQHRRVFKSKIVAQHLLQQYNNYLTNGTYASTPLSANAGMRTVGDYMRLTYGGYTGQEIPLNTPVVYNGSWLRYMSDLTRSYALTLSATPVLHFLKQSIIDGCVILRMPNGVETFYGNPSAEYPYRVRMRVHSWNFFFRVAAEADLGLARSFIANEWTCDDLTALFNIFILNRDKSVLSTYNLWTAWIGATMNYLSFAINMDNSISGSRKNIHAHYDLSNDLFVSFLDPNTMMYSCAFFDTTRRYVQDVDVSDLGNKARPNHIVDAESGKMIRTDRTTPTSTPSATTTSSSLTNVATLAQGEQTLLSSLQLPEGSPSTTIRAINEEIQRKNPNDADKMDKLVPKGYTTPFTPTPSTRSQPRVEILYNGTLEEAQLRKLDHLIATANVQQSDYVLDLGFGWGGLSIRLAETIGCKVHGITLSKEQYELAYERVRSRGLEHLITFEIVDYRVFAQQHPGEFDKIISIEMIEAVGSNYFDSYLHSLDRLLAPNGVAVIQAITMPDPRYDEYIHTTDFINTIIFPGGCCPSLTALLQAMTKSSTMVLDRVENFNLHYGETLRRWRANFFSMLDDVIRPLGFDDAFIKTWAYYLCYCEAGFSTQTLGLQVLRFTRPNNTSLITNYNTNNKLIQPIGPFTNDVDHPVLIPSGLA